MDKKCVCCNRSTCPRQCKNINVNHDKSSSSVQSETVHIREDKETQRPSHASWIGGDNDRPDVQNNLKVPEGSSGLAANQAYAQNGQQLYEISTNQESNANSSMSYPAQNNSTIPSQKSTEAYPHRYNQNINSNMSASTAQYPSMPSSVPKFDSAGMPYTASSSMPFAVPKFDSAGMPYAASSSMPPQGMQYPVSTSMTASVPAASSMPSSAMAMQNPAPSPLPSSGMQYPVSSLMSSSAMQYAASPSMAPSGVQYPISSSITASGMQHPASSSVPSSVPKFDSAVMQYLMSSIIQNFDSAAMQHHSNTAAAANSFQQYAANVPQAFPIHNSTASMPANYPTVSRTATDTTDSKPSLEINSRTTSTESILSQHFPLKLTIQLGAIRRLLDGAETQFTAQNQACPELYIPYIQAQSEHFQPPYSSIAVRNDGARTQTQIDPDAENYFSCDSDLSDSEECSELPEDKPEFPNSPFPSDRNQVILQLLHEIVHLLHNDLPRNDDCLQIANESWSKQNNNCSEPLQEADDPNSIVPDKLSCIREKFPIFVDKIHSGVLSPFYPCNCYIQEMNSVQAVENANTPALPAYITALASQNTPLNLNTNSYHTEQNAESTKTTTNSQVSHESKSKESAFIYKTRYEDSDTVNQQQISEMEPLGPQRSSKSNSVISKEFTSSLNNIQDEAVNDTMPTSSLPSKEIQEINMDQYLTEEMNIQNATPAQLIQRISSSLRRHSTQRTIMPRAEDETSRSACTESDVQRCTCSPDKCSCPDESNVSRRSSIYADSYQCEEFDEEYEIKKKLKAKKQKKSKPHGICICCNCGEKKQDQNQNNEQLLQMLRSAKGNSSPDKNEMKFFIDSLITDMNAMEHTRRKCQTTAYICNPRMQDSPRDSFPVTIREVSELASNSLYVKWTIHDCYGISGYEIYVDGYLTNRYYHSRHESAVVTNVDVTVPHKIALLAQATIEDECIDLICGNMIKKNKQINALREIKEKQYQDNQLKSHISLWRPSIYLYDPKYPIIKNYSATSIL